MPGFLAQHVDDQVLDCFFGGKAIIPPSTLYVGLSRAPAFKGGRVAEPDGSSYARAAVPNDPAHFPASCGGTKANAIRIAFPTPAEDWGAILSVFVADAPAGGVVLAAADLSNPMEVAAGGGPPTIREWALFFSHS